jgi:alpha-amylase
LWTFAQVQANLATIAAAGYNAVQVSPLEPTKQSSISESQWYLFYQPCDLTVGNAQLGDEAAFKALTAAAATYGIKIIVDAVLNQTADNGTVGGFDPNVASYIQNNKATWFHNLGTVADWTNRYDETQECLGNGPDWNTQNTTVQSLMLGFLNQCVADGAGGFRFDAAKSIETNAGVDAGNSWTGAGAAHSVTLYKWDPANLALTTTAYSITGTGNFWDDVLPNLTNPSLFLYGEVIEGAGDNEAGYQTYYRTTATNAMGQIYNAVSSGNLTSLTSFQGSTQGAENPNKIVVYTEDWDDYAGSLYQTAAQTYTQRLLENAIFTARAGMVNIVFVRPNEGLWWDPSLVAVNAFRNAVVGDTEWLEYSGNGAVASNSVLAIKRQYASGTNAGLDQGIVLVNASSSVQSVQVATSLPVGSYTDKGPSGKTFTVTAGTTGIASPNGTNTLTGSVPANGVVVLLQ